MKIVELINNTLVVQMSQEEYNRLISLYTQWQDSHLLPLEPNEANCCEPSSLDANSPVEEVVEKFELITDQHTWECDSIENVELLMKKLNVDAYIIHYYRNGHHCGGFTLGQLKKYIDSKSYSDSPLDEEKELLVGECLNKLATTALRNSSDKPQILKWANFIGQKLSILEAAKIVLHYTITSYAHIKDAYESGWINELQYRLLTEEVDKVGKEKK